MSEDLRIRSLTRDDFVQMYQTFIEAFSQYSVNMNMSKSTFRNRMINKLRLEYQYSPGFFSGDKLVAFIFHAINTYEGTKTAYNGGTGVIPGYWGRGYTKKMYEYISPMLFQAGVERCVLEVITTNISAIKAYEKTGFTKTKYYKCFKLTGKISNKPPAQLLSINKVHSTSISQYEHLQSSHPSMLDSNEQLELNIRNEAVLEARLDKELCGYAIFQPHLGRISQLGIHPDHRCKGIGTFLLRSIWEMSEVKALTIINIPDHVENFISFLSNNGFKNQLDQYEMELKL